MYREGTPSKLGPTILTLTAEQGLKALLKVKVMMMISMVPSQPPTEAMSHDILLLAPRAAMFLQTAAV
jgi:hypothetical protein